MGKKKPAKKEAYHFRVESDLHRAIEEYRHNQECLPTPPEAIRTLLRKALGMRSAWKNAA